MSAMRNRLSGRDLTLILAVTALWGFTFVPIKVALVEVPPFALAALRFLLAAVPVCFFVRRPAMPARSVIAYGLAIGVMQFGLLFLGMKLGMPAGLSSLTIQVQVFFTMGLAVLFTHDRLQRHHLTGAAIATAGIVVLGAYKIAAGASVTFIGFLLVLGAAVGWALGNIVAKRAAGDHGADMFSLVVWSSLVPPLPLAAALVRLRRRPRAGTRRAAHERPRVGVRARHVVRRDALRLRDMEPAAAPLPDGPHLALRAAHPGVGPRQRRDLPRRIHCRRAGARRRARAPAACW